MITDMAPSDIAWNPDAKPGPLHCGFTTAPEILDEVDLPVTGQIPPYVTGLLFRNGPGLYEVTHKNGETTQFNHWFDGIATVHRFRIDGGDGTVSYKNRRTMPDVIAAAEAAPSTASYRTIHFGDQDPCRTLLGRFFQSWRPHSKPPGATCPPMNINVTLERVPGAGALVARTDVNKAAVLDVDTLEAKRHLTYGDLNPSLNKAFTAAHSASDPNTGEHFNYCFDMGRAPVPYTVFSLARDGSSRVLATIDEAPRYIHSLAATKSYVVLIMYSLVANVWRMLAGEPYASALEFRRDLRTKFYVVSRAEGKVVAVYDADPFFCFHNINAFEAENGDVQIDLVLLENGEGAISQYYRENLVRKPADFFTHSAPRRFTLADIPAAAAAYAEDATAVSVAEDRCLADVNIELPCISPKFAMREHRFAYGVSSQQGDFAFNSLVKTDATTGKYTIWSVPNTACGEPIFVPKPGSNVEDEGVLLSVVLDAEEKRSFMAVIDAQTMTEVARATVPQPVPLGFHGRYMGEDEYL